MAVWKSLHLWSHETENQLTAMAYLSDRMRALAATGSPKAAELLEKANALDEALAKDPSDLTTVLGAWTRAQAVWSEVARLRVCRIG
jgi:phosphoglycerate-specific signal transduction histidine kinase